MPGQAPGSRELRWSPGVRRGSSGSSATASGPAGPGTSIPSTLLPYGFVGGGRHLEERDLADLHPRVDRDRQVGDVRQLERQVPVPSRVDEPGGGVDEQAEAAERADLPSSRATRSSGSATRSRVEPSTNSPGCRMNAPPSAISTSSVRSSWGASGRCTASCRCGRPGSSGRRAGRPTTAGSRLVERVDHDAARGELLADRASERITGGEPNPARVSHPRAGEEGAGGRGGWKERGEGGGGAGVERFRPRSRAASARVEEPSRRAGEGGVGRAAPRLRPRPPPTTAPRPVARGGGWWGGRARDYSAVERGGPGGRSREDPRTEAEVEAVDSEHQRRRQCDAERQAEQPEHRQQCGALAGIGRGGVRQREGGRHAVEDPVPRTGDREREDECAAGATRPDDRQRAEADRSAAVPEHRGRPPKLRAIRPDTPPAQRVRDRKGEEQDTGLEHGGVPYGLDRRRHQHEHDARAPVRRGRVPGTDAERHRP